MALGSLDEQTRVLLNNRPRGVRYYDIARALDINQRWIGLYHRGEVKQPDVKKVQALYEYLTGRPLFQE